MVGRPRQFDEDEVLDAAMKAFWANGYEATSLTELVSVTGLHKGSLYQAFGDKHSLFIQTLKRYLHGIRECKRQALAQAETPLGGVRAVLHGFIDMSGGASDCPQGCMAVKTLVEMVPHDPEVQRIMEEHMMSCQASLHERVVEAQANGDLSEEKSPEMIVAIIMIFMNGLATQAIGEVSLEEAHALLDVQLEALL